MFLFFMFILFFKLVYLRMLSDSYTLDVDIVIKTRKLQQVSASLLPCSHQADIRMRSHRLLRLDNNKSVVSCQDAN